MKRVFLSCILLLGLVCTAWGQEDAGAGDDGQSFRQLDNEAEALLLRVLDMGAEMAALDEQRQHPEQTQLMVLFSLEAGLDFTPGLVELRLDGKPMASQRYSSEQLRVLKQGGAHRLYWDNVPAGRHEISALLLEDAGDKKTKIQRQSSLMFVSGSGRRVMEVSLSPSADPKQPIPRLAIKEWK